MIHKIYFKNYKSFKNEEILELKPITILIGKNSSGKSAVAKLPTLIEGALSGEFVDPLLTNNQGVELGAEFRDLIYGRNVGSLEFTLYENGDALNVEIAQGLKETDLPKIRTWKYNQDIHLSYDDNDKMYSDSKSNNKYNVVFHGFNVFTGMETHNLFPTLSMKLRTNYIGPFRSIPNRTYMSLGNSTTKKIGIKGEFTYQILISDHLYNDGKLLSKVSQWYETNFDGWGVQVNSNSKPDYKIELTRKSPRFSINMRDVGEGMSQALPLVVSAFQEVDEETLTIIEQPELHLHPAAHGNLAELFAESSKSQLKKFLIETHSKNFILRLRRMIAEGNLKPDHLALYSIEYDSESNSSQLKKIKVTELGEVSYWPENVFSESLDETIAIRTAQLKKQEE